MDAALKLVILTYHSISDGLSPLEIPPALFVEQMEWLKANANVAPLKTVVSALKQGKPLPERTVVLTFDDGYVDFGLAFGPLQKFEFPAIVFLPTAHVGGKNSWTNSYLAEKPLMSWGFIKLYARLGVEFGAHSVSHSRLTELAALPCEQEVRDSKVEIELQTRSAVRFFCYPYGIWNPSVRARVVRRYEGACSTGAGVVEADADPYALPRVDAHYVRNMRWFRSMFTRRFEAYIATRRAIRRLRGQPEGNYARV